VIILFNLFSGFSNCWRWTGVDGILQICRCHNQYTSIFINNGQLCSTCKISRFRCSRR